MNASELRIGNLIYSKDHGIIEIFSLNDEYKTYNSGDHTRDGWSLENEAKPISLTEEWLMKLYMSDGKPVKLWKDENLIYIVVQKWFKENIKFVHQLQNFYFAHENEELIYKQ